MADDITDTGPTLEGLTNSPPTEGSSNDMSYTADFTAYYELTDIPAVYIEPPLTNVWINFGNVNFTLSSNSVATNGVTWSIIPEGLTNGAEIAGYPSNAVVNAGGVATSYVVRATANDNTNIYGDAVLNVVEARTPLQYKIGTNSWEDMPDPLYVCKDTAVDFKAIKTPTTASWPNGKPAWGGLVSGAGVDTNSYTFNTISASTSDYKIVTAECGNTVTGKIIVCNVEFGAGFERVAPTKTQTVSVTTFPSPLPSGVSVSLSAVRTYGDEGSASVNPSNITCSTNVNVLGGEQSWGAGDNAAPSNMVLVAQLLESDATNGTSFTICAHVVDFNEYSRAITTNAGTHYLKFVYIWDSDSGNNSGLDKVLVGEHVAYPDGNPYVPPTPPYEYYGYTNPTVKNVIGTFGGSQDSHGHPGFVTPYTNCYFTGVQNYRYHCNRCMPAGNSNDLNWGTLLFHTMNIDRTVYSTNGQWKYTISKDGLSAEEDLP